MGESKPVEQINRGSRIGMMVISMIVSVIFTILWGLKLSVGLDPEFLCTVGEEPN